MSGYNWDNCPLEIKEQITNITDFLYHTLGENLIGNYLHGSICLGSFQPSHSDLDISDHPTTINCSSTVKFNEWVLGIT
ncbi:Uncharacterised protein [Actinobacillus pleuropneumoniae]|nr:Uncharacterised protein [Actinobacillus pleuropneumoniae]